jgi:hypothetical protein
MQKLVDNTNKIDSEPIHFFHVGTHIRATGVCVVKHGNDEGMPTYLVEYDDGHREWMTEETMDNQCEPKQDELDLFPRHKYNIGTKVRKYFGSLYRGRFQGNLDGVVKLHGYSEEDAEYRTYLVEYEGGYREWLKEDKVENIAVASG